MDKAKKKPQTRWSKIWYFIWEDDSVWSWLVNVVLAFILIKFIVYPGLGLILGTNYPVVAVVSGSMEHNGLSMDKWWASKFEFYQNFGITQNEFIKYPFKNGFNTGDIMVLRGAKPENIRRGDILVFKSGRPDPIIHRIVKVWTTEADGKITYHYQTKGDHNSNSIMDISLNEIDIKENQVVGRAVFRIPYLGWVKILFFKIFLGW